MIDLVYHAFGAFEGGCSAPRSVAFLSSAGQDDSGAAGGVPQTVVANE
jgi:hypothetical protein